ncbi:MAG: response regulator transcription factor [Bacteroidia bacterium]|nr:response regulator transcription factor [Bacteroidota bacterium]MBP9081622.1 response regulator transcription factor [Bacteroidia bacterium]MBK7391044.1 response regulator transcription factor [Bacteroidota bacterium]MBK7968075.1 response regulator transcription factor [Bacteroidota bacterium]MBK8417142.1 response regulator transcription factor [Bacteroidota bacterium]
MKYLIIEDEDPAATRLEKLIAAAAPDFILQNHIVSIRTAVKWLQENEHPDLIFMDIQLADGISFEIFNQIPVKCPVIFTTAFDQYAIQAFKVNSIDYLLKPVKNDELEAAIAKFRKSKTSTDSPIPYEKLLGLLKGKPELHKRLLIRFGETIKAVEVSDVAYFYTENKINYLCTFDKKTYPLDFNLDQLESMIDPEHFFRINRQFIVHIKAINKMVSYSKSRVKLELVPPTEIETIVSTERSPNFKNWLTGSGQI